MKMEKKMNIVRYEDVLKDLAEVRAFLKLKPWRESAEQIKIWQQLLSNLCKLHKVDELRLKIRPGTISHYNKAQNEVVLDKFSLITLLHEFGHHLGMNESYTKAYSESVFLCAYPRAMRITKRDARGYLVTNTAQNEESVYKEGRPRCNGCRFVMCQKMKAIGG